MHRSSHSMPVAGARWAGSCRVREGEAGPRARGLEAPVPRRTVPLLSSSQASKISLSRSTSNLE